MTYAIWIYVKTSYILSGDPICTRILIERFADKNIRDVKGQTAYEIADNENFVDVMKLLSQFQGGFLGPVQVSRGSIMMKGYLFWL